MIYISLGHKRNNPNQDTGAVFKDLKEAEEVYQIGQLLCLELARLDVSFCMLEDMSLEDTISFLNKQMRTGDVAIELHKDSFETNDVRRVGCYVNKQSKLAVRFGECFLQAFKGECSKDSWIRSHTERKLGFVRKINNPSVIVELGHMEDAQCVPDRQFYAQKLALAINNFSKI
jgi:N-acetylmuramoyl-L-alanine amidase